jgi:hypothetical protein
MANHDVVLVHVQAAMELLAKAKESAPLRSNLRDELDSLAEQCDVLQARIASQAYDEVGMET